MENTANLDRAATGLSLVCLVHCLLLPLVAASAPFLAVLAEAEWLHASFAALAVVASCTVIASAPGARSPRFLVPALAGISFLILGVFAEALALDETLLTVVGGLLLASAHGLRLYRGLSEG